MLPKKPTNGLAADRMEEDRARLMAAQLRRMIDIEPDAQVAQVLLVMVEVLELIAEKRSVSRRAAASRE